MITIIEGKGGARLGTAMRNAHIGTGTDEEGVPRGFLLVNAGERGEPRHLIEKLLHGQALPADGTPVEAKALRWKRHPQVAFIGSNDKLLARFEELVPGFTEKCGPVHTVNADA